jgi:RNA polymerase sigma-70 factor (ECF subfamily)
VLNKKQREFSELIEPHTTSLLSTANRMTRNRNDAEDLVQETLFKAYRAIDQYQSNTNFRAWIFRILVNTYITAYRKAIKIPQRLSYEDIEEFTLFKNLRPLDVNKIVDNYDLFENSFEDDVKSALENLPYQFRLVVLLCDVEGFSYNDISEIIGSPLGTVMSRLYRGRKLLQRMLWNYAKNRGYVDANTKIKR